ncbi:hypothetical protein [Sphingomonas metalli]|nr:hypothetical protein [Sphingomonas metalli]
MFQNLRAGPVMAGVGVNSSTVRAWIRNNGLKLSDDRGALDKRPLYDLADAGRLYLMRILTTRLGMPAQLAADATNAATLIIEGLAAWQKLRMDGGESAVAPDQWIMVLGGLDGTSAPSFYTADVVKERGFVIAEVFVDLRAVVRMALEGLCNVLGVSVFDLPREDD